MPRLELLGAVLCARLIVFVREALRLPDIVQHRCWTDSMLVLIWIKSDYSRWKEFAANRVADIQSHCRGGNNPADLLTRGLSAQELLESEMWLYGPPFLLSDVSPCESLGTTGHVDASEKERTHMLLVASAVNDKMQFNVEQWSINPM